MNTYDPMDRIVYRHLDTQRTPATIAADVHRLPAGYANGSPRTYLGRPRRTAPAALSVA